jgi:hypothetical protein
MRKISTNHSVRGWSSSTQPRLWENREKKGMGYLSNMAIYTFKQVKLWWEGNDASL